MKTKIKLFFSKLRTHPGVPIVIACQILGFATGITSPNAAQLERAFAGLVIMSLFWIPVFWTAWKYK
jgi:hypothetical protein